MTRQPTRCIPWLFVVAVAAGCQAKIEAYYNANEKIVARRLFWNNQRHIAVNADGPLSRPAVARYRGDTWVAWSYDYQRPSGEWVKGIGIGAAPCTFDGARRFDELGTASLSTPGLAAYGGRLVLVWCRDDQMILRTSTDGTGWSEPAALPIGPVPHVALAVHEGRLYAAAPIPVGSDPAGSGGTVAVFGINDDFTWGARHDVIAHPALRPDRGVSLASGGGELFIAYALEDRAASVSRSPSGVDSWVHEPEPVGNGDGRALVLVPDLYWDASKDRLRAAWTDGARLWLAEQRDPPAWEYAQGDVYTPSLSNPAGAALLMP